MSIPLTLSETWETLLDVSSRVVALHGDECQQPILLSSLPVLPGHKLEQPQFSLIHGPPGRNIAIAIGLRAALPDTPLLLIMNADGITLGTNHLIHAARRNIDMTLLLLHSEVTETTVQEPLDRIQWETLGFQQDLENKAKPLDWAIAFQAALVGRGSLLDRDGLAELINDSIETPGFSLVEVTAGTDLELGVLSRTEWPEYFTAYRQWATSFMDLAGGVAKEKGLIRVKPFRSVPRCEVRVMGLGGQGVKLAGMVLSEAAGLLEGLWATHKEEYGSATRGGPSMVDVVISSDRITYPGADNPDILIILSQDKADSYAAKLKQGAHLVVDPDQVKSVPHRAIPVPINRLARELTGRSIAAGVVSLGCAAALSDVVSLDSIRQSVARKVPLKTIEKNIAALDAGYTATCKALEGESDGK